MEEAGRLCHKVAPVDQGRIVAAGTPRELAQQADARTRVQFVPSEPFDDALLTGLPEVSGVEHYGPRVQVSGTGDLASVVIAALAAHGVTAHELELSSATPEDAFIQLTGQRAAPVPGSGGRSRVSRIVRPREKAGRCCPARPHAGPSPSSPRPRPAWRGASRSGLPWVSGCRSCCS